MYDKFKDELFIYNLQTFNILEIKLSRFFFSLFIHNNGTVFENTVFDQGHASDFGKRNLKIRIKQLY